MYSATPVAPTQTQQRVKPGKRPGVRVHDARGDDHDIFGTDGSEDVTPCRGRRVVDLPIAPPQDDSVVRVGRKHISPRHSVDHSDSKGFASGRYDPKCSDRFQSSKRFESSGNILCGGALPDSFETKRPTKEVTGRTNVSSNILAHSAPDPERYTRDLTPECSENARRNQGATCPFAREDGVAPPEAPVKQLHPGNKHHGDVLTGGQMAPQHAGSRLVRHF
eukprot:TRINITY_DN51151_c0_g1_i1.p2 TRINITY_DN51151_c0_g1~~TRINITY_DN51151_c0_g1_i1.p2  ORF type:complete len:250 (+),score=82.71 TRINITY_DN51151_c0_g1_i1:88-750(+)